METAQASLRRRKDHTRWTRSERAIKKKEVLRESDLLRRWRRSLAKIESEAAHYHCADIEMLVGAAALAVEELISTPGVGSD